MLRTFPGFYQVPQSKLEVVIKVPSFAKFWMALGLVKTQGGLVFLGSLAIPFTYAPY